MQRNSSYLFLGINTKIVCLWCLGWGTDEKAIIRLLGQRNASQRKKIREEYHQLYNKSLIDDLHSELSGDFRVISLLFFTFGLLFTTYLSDTVNADTETPEFKDIILSE